MQLRPRRSALSDISNRTDLHKSNSDRKAKKTKEDAVEKVPGKRGVSDLINQ